MKLDTISPGCLLRARSAQPLTSYTLTSGSCREQHCPSSSPCSPGQTLPVPSAGPRRKDLCTTAVLQHLKVFLVMRGPKLDTALKAQPPWCPQQQGQWSARLWWPHSCRYRPGCLWPSWLPGHMNGSCSDICQTTNSSCLFY